jgi:hypothetical protein
MMGGGCALLADEEYLILCWGSEPGKQADVADKDQAKPRVQVTKRTLLQLAAFHGSLRCVSCLLARGANPNHKSSDGLTAYDVSVAAVWGRPAVQRSARKGHRHRAAQQPRSPPPAGGRVLSPLQLHQSAGHLQSFSLCSRAGRHRDQPPITTLHPHCAPSCSTPGSAAAPTPRPSAPCWTTPPAISPQTAAAAAPPSPAGRATWRVREAVAALVWRLAQ